MTVVPTSGDADSGRRYSEYSSSYRHPFSFGSASALLNFMSQYVMVFLTPFYLQRLLSYAPGDVGLIMTAFPLAAVTSALRSEK